MKSYSRQRACFVKIPAVCSSSKFLLNCGVLIGASFGSTFSSSEVWPRLKLSNEFLFWGTKSPPKYAYEFPIKNEAKTRISNKGSTLCIFERDLFFIIIDMYVLTYRFLLLAKIAICKAIMIPIDATMGKSNEFS